MGTELPPVPQKTVDIASWVQTHLGHLLCDEAVPSPAFRGGQSNADEQLDELDISGYARSRSMVWPPSARGASKLSPYIRYGLLPLRRVWEATNEASNYDRFRYQGELLWQEYARQWYALYGERTGAPLHYEPVRAKKPWDAPVLWNEMECVRRTLDELHTDGWIVNQTRMWLASQWSVRGGADPADGEDWMFRHLLDGSRAANRMGWQWVAGTSRPRAGGFARQQVMKRAPQFCKKCRLSDNCPISGYARTESRKTLPAPPTQPIPEAFGPEQTRLGSGPPQRVWLTGESLGRQDPALAAHPDLPAIFVFDEALLAKLRLSGKRLIFLAETLGELASTRDLTILLGRPAEVLGDVPSAVTFAPVPGFQRLARSRSHLELHPWMWLRPPTPEFLSYLDAKDRMPSFKEWCQLSKPEPPGANSSNRTE